MRMFWVVSLQSHSFVPPLLLQKYSIVWFYFFFRFSKGLSASPAFTLTSFSIALPFQRVQKSLHILEVINLVCRHFSPTAVRCEGCIFVILALPASISVTYARFNHSVSFSFFPISQHLQKRRMMQDIWMWLCQKWSILPQSWARCQRGWPATRYIRGLFVASLCMF